MEKQKNSGDVGGIEKRLSRDIFTVRMSMFDKIVKSAITYGFEEIYLPEMTQRKYMEGTG